ncbi:amino acid adenylation domain-containing protein [Chitinophaga sp. GbtcB8]|uniref:amino acid adenylation domain-containing protein n=1 Tax=Chitinophaga sp. GbtcB8 TaxID=2824753 RepID=UPI0034CE1097
MEKAFATIYEQVLNKQPVGITDDFFNLGGDSIKILRTISALRKQLALNISIADFYKHSTIESLVQYLSGRSNENSEAENRSKAEVLADIAALKDRVLSGLNDAEQVEDIFPMSDIEKGMVYESLVNKGLGVYHDVFVNHRVLPGFDMDRFRRAFALLIEKHALLRTAFLLGDDDGDLQIVYKTINAPVNEHDLTHLEREAQEQEIRSFLQADATHPFNVTAAPLWRADVFRISRDEIVLSLQFHHAVLDGWSHANLLTELNNVYLELEHSAIDRLPLLRSSYKDFVIQQQADKRNRSLHTFWEQELAGYKRPDLFTGEYEYNSFLQTLDHAYQDKLQALAVTLSTSIRTISLSAYLYLLKVLSADNEVVAGLVTNTRPGLEDSDKVLGCFLNTVPLRATIGEDVTAAGWVKQVEGKLLALKEPERVSLVEIARLHPDAGQGGGNPFFDTFFNFVNFHVYEGLKGNDDATGTEAAAAAFNNNTRARTNMPLEVNVNLTGNVFNARFFLSRKLRSGLTVSDIGKMYFRILQHIADAPDQLLRQAAYIDAAEEQQLLHTFNDTATDFPADKTMVHLFEEQVSRRPEKVALVFGESTFTYRELNEQANRLAAHLRSTAGIQPNDLVSIQLDRSEWMIISILGVLKSGAAYIPIDPSYPQDRIDYMVADSQSKVLINDAWLAAFREQQQQYGTENLPIVNQPTDLAYVIYTSGSTGRPKGCMLEHRGVVNRVEWMYRQYAFSDEDVILQKTTFTFDVSVWEIFMPLCWGVKMVLCHKDDIASPQRILRLIATQGVTCLHFVPSMLSAFITALFEESSTKAALQGLRLLITSGEALPVETVKKWYSLVSTPIHNLYGPTEASVDVTFYATTPQDNRVPIGRPIWNTQLYILGKSLELLPLGVAGEICIGGVGLSRGYLHKPELTAQKFVENPFRKNERLYRTGDLGQWLPDGNIVYLGRIDDQVKIRGYRIELGEIESVLLQSGLVSQAAAIVKADAAGTKRLLAFVVPAAGYSLPQLQQYLTAQVPDYMHPAAIIELSVLPLTPNGKADKKALAALQHALLPATEYTAPRNATEQTIAAIWEEVLAADRIGVHDNFFTIGGDSIISIRILSKLKKEFHKEIELRTFYEMPTIAALAAHVTAYGHVPDAKLQLQQEITAQLDAMQQEVLRTAPNAAAIAEVYPMSDIQKGMVFEQLKDPENGTYHDQFVYQLPLFDLDIFKQAFTLLVEKHSILRTGFDIYNMGSDSLQIVYKTVPVNMLVEDLTDKDAAAQQAYIRQYITDERKRPFDLSIAPLWRISIFVTAADQMVYLFQFHHAILDGWSVASLNTELHHLCLQLQQDAAYRPAPLMADNKTSIISSLAEKAQEENIRFWQQELADHKRLSVFENKALAASFEKNYPPDYLPKLENAAKLQGVPVRTLFLGAYLYTLQLLTAETDLTIGLVSNVRPVCEDGDKILGCFLNTIPLRYQQGSTAGSWRQYTMELDHKLRSLKGRDRLSLYEINRLSGGDIRESNPFFDVVFNYINFHVYDALHVVLDEKATKEKNSLELKSFESTNTWLDLSVSITGGMLKLIYKQKKELTGGISLAAFNEYFERALENIAFNPTGRTDKQVMLSAHDLQQLLGTFNNTTVPYLANETIQEQFERQAAATPQQIAIVTADTQLTYKELNEKANQLAAFLRGGCQVTAETLVALVSGRSAEMVVGMLGILKSGAAYVPIDPELPAERVRYMLEDARIKIVIIENEHRKAVLPTAGFEAVVIKDNPLLLQYPAVNLPLINNAANLAYVIYTSGSTGRPKGVMLEHAALSNLCNWHNRYFEVTAQSKATVYSSISFDAAGWEIWPYLLTGATLYPLPGNIRLDVTAIAAFIKEQGITHCFLPTVICEQLADAATTGLDQVKILTGGDALRHTGNLKLINNYGPTENAVVSASIHLNELNGLSVIPIGKPIDNTAVYILDVNLQLQPVGVTGEICLAGYNLARGYLHQPALTAEKFVANPFKPGERLYRTGDLGRWLPDGNIAFAGRKDEQVKIRGYRIELGEIESILQQQPGIQAAVVLARPNSNGQKELVAYLVSEVTLNITALRAALGTILPAYMLPAHFVQLDVLPLNASGKVDKKNLPDPETGIMAANVTYVAPRNEAERNLVAVYEEVLKKQSIGIKDDFLALGGDSIKSIQVVARLKQRGFTLTIQDVIRFPVIEELASKVQVVTRAVPQRLVEGLVPLGPIQSQFLNGAVLHKHHYNQSVLLYSKTPVDINALRAALDKIVQHHDALRMVFRQTETGWLQENKGKTQGYIFEEIRNISETDFAAHCDRLQSGMQLEEGPLFSVGLFRGEAGDRLLMVAHHLVIDGVSWRILFEDLSTLYQQYMAAQPLELPLKTDSFQYWQQMQQQYAQSEILQKEAVYWDALEAMHIPPVPVEHAEGSSLIKDAARQSFLLDESLTSRLLTQCYSAYRTEVNDLLLGAFSMAVAEVFELEKVLINLEGHGRENIGANVDVTRTVGWFTSMYPVVFDMRHREDAIRQLITVKETLHRVPNKGMGYGILRYTAGRNYRLQPQIAFNYLGDFGAGVQDAEGKQLFGFSGDYQGRAISPDEPRAVLLDVLGMVTEGQLRLTISYSTHQYSKPVIARLLACFQAQLEELINALSATAATHLTPVDLTYKELSMEQVEQLDVDGNTEDVYPLSHLQEGLYYHWLSTPGSLAYCEQMSYRLKGTLNLDALERSYEMLVARHAVLRTSFTQELDSSVLQVVKKKVLNNFQYLDVSGQADPVIEDIKRNIRQQGFDLHSGSQMNLTVLGLGADTYEFIWGHHHILMDGWCVGILIKEFSELYEGLLQGRKTSLPEVQPYAGYISWLMQQDKERSLQYWRHYLADYDTVSTLPQLAAGNHAAFEPAERAFNLGTAATAAIKALCAQLRITENTFIQTIWGLLLSRYNNTRDVVFGAVVSGRPGEIKGIEEMIGLFINTIPVRIRINEGATAEALLKAVQESAISAAAHHYTQLADVLAVSEPGGGLVDHILIFENYPVQEMVEQHAAGRQQQQELLVISSAGVEQTSYNLSVSVIPGNNFRIRFEYNSMVYAAQLMAALEEHFTQLVIQVLDNPAVQIDTVCYLSEAEKQQQLIAFNEPGIMDYPKDKTVIELLQEQVTRTPENIAVIFKDRTLSYQQLHEQSNRLAHYLKAQYNIQPNDLIGIKLDRSEWVMITVLAVLKSGGAYVPVDPDYPQERIDYIVEDSKCKVLVDEDLLEAFHKAAQQYPASNLSTIPQPGDLAYIIYTSGSTCNPKGVMIGHLSLVNLALGVIRQYNVTEKDRILQFASLSFDMSVEETFPFLLKGAGVVIRQDVELQPSGFRRFVVDNKITILNIPPLFFPVIHELEESEKADLFATVRMIAFGGEALPDGVLRAAQGYGIQLFNAYGPTESTVNAVIADSTHGVSSVIGKPFANTQLYVLDAALQLLPIGVSGELYIAGDGLAKGYLYRPELTAEKFIDNPFGEGKLYRTGDVVRWTQDGNIVFIGRQDDQVKIRGYRIELGEIETTLQLHEQVNGAVVVARSGTDGEKMLVAYVTGNVELNIAELRTHLNKTLPSYMIPSQFVQLDSFPVTANGKVNKKQLPDPQGAGMATSVEYVAPRNETEVTLVSMWQEILRVEKIGIKDDFFELGGHSLKVARLAGQIHKTFDYRIALKDIFFNPTIEALGDMIRAGKWIESSRQIKQENRDVIEL